MARLPKPVFNIIKRVTSLFVASLTSARFKLQFFPLSDYAGGNVREPEENAAAFATAEVENLLEKFKMEYRIREALYDRGADRRLLRAFLVGSGRGAVWRRGGPPGARSRWSWWTGST